MPDFCTCGAQLPADALFCHKCGKPQREIMAAEPEPPPPVAPVFAPPPVTPRYSMPVNFRNPIAMRIALLVGIAGSLVSNVLPLISWAAAGFFAVFFYRRKTHDRMNAGSGMRMGWLTGLIMFAMWGLAFAALGLSGRLTTQFEEGLKSLPFASDPNVQQMARSMTSGPGLVFPLLFGFIVITCLSIVGGALGASLKSRD